MTRTERQAAPLKVVSVLDLVLAIISIVFGIILLVTKVSEYFLDYRDEAPPPRGQPIIFHDSALTKAAWATCLILAMIVLHAIQAVMAVLLFTASKKLTMEPLDTCRAMKIYLVWSGIMLLILAIGTITYAAILHYYISWLILSFLLVQLVFRIFAIFFVGSSRRKVRSQFLRSDIPWVNPNLPPNGY